jgi:hypothetical protein
MSNKTMKKLISIGLLGGFLWLSATIADAQTATFETKRKSGYTLSIAFTLKTGKVQSVSVDEWTPVNKSFHERGVEGTRGDGDSTWTDGGGTTSIERDGSSVLITRRGSGFLVTTDWSDVQILFTKIGVKYVGKILSGKP